MVHSTETTRTGGMQETEDFVMVKTRCMMEAGKMVCDMDPMGTTSSRITTSPNGSMMEAFGWTNSLVSIRPNLLSHSHTHTRDISTVDAYIHTCIMQSILLF